MDLIEIGLHTGGYLPSVLRGASENGSPRTAEDNRLQRYELQSFLTPPCLLFREQQAKLTYPEINDVFAVLFPHTYDDTDIYSALLNYTRHIPRDFVQLMNYIKLHCDSNKVTKSAISKGIKEYSTEYFLPEISNELSGYLPGSAIQPVFNIISSLRSQSFTYEQFESKCKDVVALKEIDPTEILKVLYDCSAIGHSHYYIEYGGSRILYKYRNRSSSFVHTDKILLHRGLWKSMNVSY